MSHCYYPTTNVDSSCSNRIMLYAAAVYGEDYDVSVCPGQYLQMH